MVAFQACFTPGRGLQGGLNTALLRTAACVQDAAFSPRAATCNSLSPFQHFACNTEPARFVFLALSDSEARFTIWHSGMVEDRYRPSIFAAIKAAYPKLVLQNCGYTVTVYSFTNQITSSHPHSPVLPASHPSFHLSSLLYAPNAALNPPLPPANATLNLSNSSRLIAALFLLILAINSASSSVKLIPTIPIPLPPTPPARLKSGYKLGCAELLAGSRK